jgi:hypothetical protein
MPVKRGAPKIGEPPRRVTGGEQRALSRAGLDFARRALYVVCVDKPISEGGLTFLYLERGKGWKALQFGDKEYKKIIRTLESYWKAPNMNLKLLERQRAQQRLLALQSTRVTS